jgi:hypothetical protein
VTVIADPLQNGAFTVEQTDPTVGSVIVNVAAAGLTPGSGFTVPYTYVFTPAAAPSVGTNFGEKTPTVWS